MIEKEQVGEVLQSWRQMSDHVQDIARHMVRSMAAQESTERAARSSATSVKTAAWGFVFILTIASFLIGMMVNADLKSAAAYREGRRLDLLTISEAIKDTQRDVKECKDLILEHRAPVVHP